MYNINLDPDPNWAKILDPDLDQNSMYVDPQDWKIEYISKIIRGRGLPQIKIFWNIDLD